ELENEFQNVAYESQRLLNSRAAPIAGKENLPIASTKQFLSRKQRNAASRSQDLKFAADIGQQLLVECRKLQILAVEREEKLKVAESTRIQLEGTVESLESKVRQLDESEERYKEENWNLELRLQELESEKSNDSDRWSRLNMENNKHLQMYSAQIEALELAQVRENGLVLEMEALKAKYENETANYEQLVANLQQENETLSVTIGTLNEQLTNQQLSDEIDYVDGNDNFQKEGTPDVDLSDDPKTPERNPPMSPVKATPAHHAGLEGETLKASLNHAHRIISNLRGAVHREKTEKLDLRRMLDDAEKEIESLKTNKSIRRSRVLQNAPTTKRTTLLGTSGLKSKYRVSAGSTGSVGAEGFGDDAEWETFNAHKDEFMSARESATETDGGFETAQDHPTSDEDLGDLTETDNYQTGVESILAVLNEDVDTETESSSHDYYDNDSVNESPVMRSQTSGRYLQHKRDSGNFTTPQPLFNELGSSPFGGKRDTPIKASKPELKETGCMTDPWEPEMVYVDQPVPITKENIVAAAASLSMIALAKEVYEDLTTRKVSLDTIQKDAELLNLILVSKSEYDLLTAPVVATVESVTADAASLNMVVLAEPEYKELTAPPTEASIVADATTLSMTAIATAQYKSLTAPREPTLEVLEADAQNKLTEEAERLNLAVLPKEQYDSLTAPLTAAALAAGAATLSMVAISKSEYDSLKVPALAPTASVQSVIADAASLDMIALPRTEYQSLITPVPPTYESIKADAESLAMVVMPTDQYLQITSRTPSVDSVTSDAEALGLVEGLSSDSNGSILATKQVISAVTQTMIGEFLYKYTRKRGRQTMSGNRHKRYFWLHPYTRTLYWSTRNPSEAGEVKAKSVTISSVEVVHDDNPFPPGFYHKSLLIKTSTRMIQISCLTLDRFDVWYNALSFVALRTNAVPNVIARQNNAPASHAPNFGSQGLDFRKANALSSSQYANIPHSRTQASMSSYNSRTTSSGPSRMRGVPSTFDSQSARIVNHGSMGRLTSLLRPPTGTVHSKQQNGQMINGVYEAGLAIDSADELQAQIEKEEQEMDGLENVRVCCDGMLLRK
ncbi:meiotic cell cortex C-terminal pleckstrin homology-domain-containing protein, partial [Lipomyces arxii]|uniref:meiotic cell cortex C-terminal pleckstrin homology-domain-containing protein n=1 Tax=Lipomyces arxii TaxID=56418 RepID=UPI0034CED974